MKSARFAVILLVVLAGCSRSEFRASVQGFDTTTQAAVSAQRKQLDTVLEKEADSYRQRLAETYPNIQAIGCANVFAPDFDPDNCRIVRAENGQLIDVSEPFSAPNIRSLQTALLDFTGSLAALAADFDKEESAFKKSMTNLAISIGKLDGTTSKLGMPSVVDQQKLNAIATIVGEAGVLFFEQSRVRTLTQLVIEGEPVVQNAVGYLSNADQAIYTFRLNEGLARLEAANAAVSEAAESGANARVVRQRHDRLFSDYEAVKVLIAERGRDPFGALGDSYAKLVEAAQAGASAAEVREAIVSLVQTAAVVSEAIDVLIDEKDA